MSSEPNFVLLRIITNTNGSFEFAVEFDGTIGETRALLEAQLLGEGDPSRIKMTFRGVVLEKDDAVWSSLSPKKGESMFAVVVAARTVAPASLPSGVSRALGLGNASAASSSATSEHARMMEPIIDSMVAQPGFVDMIIAMSPELKAMVDQRPEIKQQLNNPDMLRMMMRSQFDPVARREMDRSLNSQMAQLNNIPGGMAMLEGIMGNMLREERYAPKTAADKKMASEENARPQEGKSANNLEAPNPWSRSLPTSMPMYPQGGTLRQPLTGTGALGTAPFMGFPFVGQPQAFYPRASPVISPQSIPMHSVQPQQPPNYSSQMAILRGMGFEDEPLMQRALEASNGDIDGAVAFIDREQN